MRFLQGLLCLGKPAWLVLGKDSFIGARTDSFSLYRESISLEKQTFTPGILHDVISPRHLPHKRDCRPISICIQLCACPCKCLLKRASQGLWNWSESQLWPRMGARKWTWVQSSARAQCALSYWVFSLAPEKVFDCVCVFNTFNN